MSNTGANTIEKFTPGGVRTLFASTGLNAPRGLAFDSLGNLYAANLGNNTIEKFTPGGVGTLFASGTPGQPTFLAIRPVPEPSTVVLIGIGGLILALARSRIR